MEYHRPPGEGEENAVNGPLDCLSISRWIDDTSTSASAGMSSGVPVDASLSIAAGSHHSTARETFDAFDTFSVTSDNFSEALYGSVAGGSDDRPSVSTERLAAFMRARGIQSITPPPPEEPRAPLEKFTLYPKLPLEMRRLIVKTALPAAAIITLKHETLYYPSHKQSLRTVRFIPELTNNFTLADLRNSRVMSLMKVDKVFRDTYLLAFPLHIKICQARRERKESKLRFCKDDLLYLTTFFGKIDLVRTTDSIKNTPAPALPFATLTHLALKAEALEKLSDDGVVKLFLETFPALVELKILHSGVKAKDGYARYGEDGYHGLDPEPEDAHLELTDHWTVQLDVLVNLMNAEPAVVSGNARVPRISYL